MCAEKDEELELSLRVLTQIWKASAGDKNAAGWVITISYAIGFILCLAAGIVDYKRKNPGRSARFRGPWLVIAALLLLLGINKQLDLQTLFLLLGKSMALKEGWYNRRYYVQALFVMILVAICILLFIYAIRRMRGRWKKYGLPFFGAVFLVVFVLARAASMNHLSMRLVYSYRIRYLIRSGVELAGILIISFSALQSFRVKSLKKKHRL